MKKFLSLILALTLVFSLFTINVMAASKAHVITITVKDTDGNVITSAKAGDTVVVELTIDNTADLVSLGYTLVYDTNAFLANTTKVSKVEKCIDKTWLDNIKKEDGGDVGDWWAYYMGAPSYNVSVAGEITFSWASGANGGIGTDDPDNEIKDNRLVGKFNLEVLDTAAGDCNLSLADDFVKCYTSDVGESQGAKLTATAVKVTVGGGEEVFDADVRENTATSVTLFAKNPTDGALTAGTYGFDFGGARFPVGIAAGTSAAQNCPVGGNFAVKLEDKDGKFLATGKVFSYNAYYGSVTSTPKTVEIK